MKNGRIPAGQEATNPLGLDSGYVCSGNLNAEGGVEAVRRCSPWFLPLHLPGMTEVLARACGETLGIDGVTEEQASTALDIIWREGGGKLSELNKKLVALTGGRYDFHVRTKAVDGRLEISCWFGKDTAMRVVLPDYYLQEARGVLRSGRGTRAELIERMRERLASEGALAEVFGRTDQYGLYPRERLEETVRQLLWRVSQGAAKEEIKDILDDIAEYPQKIGDNMSEKKSYPSVMASVEITEGTRLSKPNEHGFITVLVPGHPPMTVHENHPVVSEIREALENKQPFYVTMGVNVARDENSGRPAIYRNILGKSDKMAPNEVAIVGAPLYVGEAKDENGQPIPGQYTLKLLMPLENGRFRECWLSPVSLTEQQRAFLEGEVVENKKNWAVLRNRDHAFSAEDQTQAAAALHKYGVLYMSISNGESLRMMTTDNDYVFAMNAKDRQPVMLDECIQRQSERLEAAKAAKRAAQNADESASPSAG